MYTDFCREKVRYFHPLRHKTAGTIRLATQGFAKAVRGAGWERAGKESQPLDSSLFDTLQNLTAISTNELFHCTYWMQSSGLPAKLMSKYIPILADHFIPHPDINCEREALSGRPSQDCGCIACTSLFDIPVPGVPLFHQLNLHTI